MSEQETMADVGGVLERLRAATGPDRELDAAIEVATFVPSEWRMDCRQGSKSGTCVVTYIDHRGKRTTGTYRAPSVTYSLDAALALVERVLPGWSWGVSRLDAGLVAGVVAAPVDVEPDHEEDWGCQSAEAATGPLALCIAALQALSTRAPAEGGRG